MSGPRDDTPPGGVRMGAGREFDAIRALLERWGPLAEGVGDDAAVLRVPAGERVVASVDAAVEGVHFRRGWLSPREIGYRATAAALSDLAAMAARPTGILVALALPGAWDADLAELGEGIGAAARAAGAPIVGGNMTRAAELSLTTTVIGSTSRPLWRSGARPGDAVYVTGVLGGPLAALGELRSGAVPPERWRRRFAHPEPRLREALWLAEQGATAAVDVSDGLAADLGHLAAASGVHVVVDLELVVTVHGVDAAAAVQSGEEYELVVTAPPSLDVADFAARFELPLTRIGRVEAGPSSVELRLGGARVAPPGGHDHFSS